MIPEMDLTSKVKHKQEKEASNFPTWLAGSRQHSFESICIYVQLSTKPKNMIYSYTWRKSVWWEEYCAWVKSQRPFSTDLILSVRKPTSLSLRLIPGLTSAMSPSITSACVCSNLWTGFLWRRDRLHPCCLRKRLNISAALSAGLRSQAGSSRRSMLSPPTPPCSSVEWDLERGA